jgi:glyoxalase family protein
MQLEGIHHVTAVSARISQNHRFYTGVMGMRLVKRSVNQDDVSAYHLFYADAVGTPGTDLTFFDWNVPRERRGTHSITRTHLRVTGEETLLWWAERLREEASALEGDTGRTRDGDSAAADDRESSREGASPVGGFRVGEVHERDGRLTLDFEDPEGQRLALVDDGGAGNEPVAWERSPVPTRHQIRGLGPIVLSVPSLTGTDDILTEVMGMRAARTYTDPMAGQTNVHVYEMDEGGPHAEVHVAVQPDLPVARQGAGAVHHVAFRTPDEGEYHAWTQRLNRFRVPNSGEIDRYYFRSLYFREPNGILFEIATDGPGFAVDEDPDELGEAVALPPFLEPQRERILAHLAPIG